MAVDEAATVADLNQSRAVFRDHVARHDGRIIDTAGDSVLASFGSVVEAVKCALLIQDALEVDNQERDEERRMRFRIGVNIGDVIEQDDGTIYGDGVNIAARLEGLAQPGGVTVSGAAYDASNGKVEAEFSYLGERDVKNIPDPVRVYQIGSGEGEGDDAPSRPESKIFDQPAIAVLPFDNMSGDPEQEYFVDGLTEDIITALSVWRSFPVIARNSTFAYKGQSPDIRQVGEELGARYVLEGGVRKGGSRLRITAQLIDASNGHHLWAERYDRQVEDIFDLQDEITHRITTIVAPEVERAEQKRSAAKEPVDLAAWESHHRGMALLEDYSGEGNAGAREYFERALELDPGYSLALAGLASTHNRDLMLELSDDRKSSAKLAFEAASRAVEIDQSESFGHAQLAIAHMWPDDYDLAIIEAERSVKLNPSSSMALAILATALDAVGRHDDAIDRLRQCIQVNPRDPRQHVYYSTMARAHLGAGRYDEAATTARTIISQRPDFPHAHYILASALGHIGRHDEARTALETCERLQPGYVERRLQWQPYQDPAKSEHIHAGVRAARGD
jgi:adenylate cyclase